MSISLADIGEGDADALICRTPFPDCCKRAAIGEFYNPNNIRVGLRRDRERRLYRNRGDGYIRLNYRDRPGEVLLGEYQCCIPNECGQEECVSITLQGKI